MIDTIGLSQPDELKPFIGQAVSLFLRAKSFGISLKGKLVQCAGKPPDKWLSIESDEKLLFFEIDWRKCKITSIYTEPDIKIFVEEI